jgi:hypothetical protein
MAKGKKNPSKKAELMTSMENFLTAFESGVEHAAAKLTAMNYDVKMDRHEEAEEAHPTNNIIAASPGWLLVSIKNGVPQRWPITAWNITDYGNV